MHEVATARRIHGKGEAWDYLDRLLQQGQVWRAGSTATTRDTVPTGAAALDRELGGGWPRGALSEMLVSRNGSGELGLLMPALARISQAGKWVAWVAPPHVPHASAMAAAGVDLSRMLMVRPEADEALWAVEQALRSGTCGAVLAWPLHCDERSLRRLQLAAESGQSVAWLFREPAAAQYASPAPLRMQVAPAAGGTGVHILKRRGGGAVSLTLPCMVGGSPQGAGEAAFNGVPPLPRLLPMPRISQPA